MEAKPIPGVITKWRRDSHADVTLIRLLEPEAWGHTRAFALRLAAAYADRFPESNLWRSYYERHGVPILPALAAAIGAGTRSVAVEVEIIDGEHGQYALNSRKQRLYPRRCLFDDVVHAFRVLGRRVPIVFD
jgi:hypothetical protein